MKNVVGPATGLVPRVAALCKRLSASGLLVLVVLCAACGGPQSAVVAADAASIPFAPTPDSDPFYAQPESMPEVPPGTVLRSRSTTVTPLLGVPLPYTAWQIQYVSTDVNGRLQAVVATVVKPLMPSLAGQPVLLAYQMAYDSLGSACTPSHTLSGSTNNITNQLDSVAYLQAMLTQGWTLVFPDYEGPYSEYGAGVQAGRATLDAIRAALSFAPLGLAAKTPVAMWGYSGGALASSWAASLQASYAPELNIVAVASGGTPTNTFNIVKHAENGSYFSLILGAVIGTNRAYPELIPPGFLNQKGLAMAQGMKDGCTGDTTDGSPAPTGTFAQYTTVEDPFSTPGARSVSAKTILPQPGKTPIANIYIYHAIKDQLLPIADTDTMVATWCADGAHVSYYRDPVGQDHVSEFAAGADLAFAYLVGRLSGTPLTIVPPGSQTCN
ncbi:MAG TPA: lipase family protein [Stenotrophobium sp.]|nr:lipase family protein [Stenotrophobium sp.]